MLFRLTDSNAMVRDSRENTRTRNENRKAMTFAATADRREKRQHATWEGGIALSYRVIDAPHKHAEQRLVCAKQFNLLVFHPEMFLLQLAEPAGHLWRARHACRP